MPTSGTRLAERSASPRSRQGPDTQDTPWVSNVPLADSHCSPSPAALPTRASPRRSRAGPPTSHGGSPAAGRRSPSSTAPDLFFNDTAPTEIYTLSLHDALPI